MSLSDFEPDELEGLQQKWPRIVGAMLDMERTIDTQAAEIERLRGELDDIQAHVIEKWDGDTDHDDAPMHETIDAILTSIRDGWADEAAIQKDRALAAEAEIERLRASLDEAVGVLRQIADRAGDGRRTASLPVIAREARDFITKHGGGS
jgi:hypothetical protein